tara:strand:+ start:411 stop:1664 length:1254 start_codon:yes stop_codon:yes gene_type:complete
VELDNESVKQILEIDDRIDNQTSPRYKSVGEALEGIATTASSMASGAISATLGLPTDVIAAGVGIKDAIFADEGKRMDAFSKGFTEVSKENMGSEFYKENFNQLLDSLIDNPVLKQDAKSGFSAGEFGGVGGVVAKAPKIARNVIAQKETAREILSSLGLSSKAMKSMNVDNMNVNSALNLAKKLKVARAKLYGADEQGNVGNAVMAMTAKREPSPVRQMTKADQTISVFPKPEKLFPKGEAPKGGDYINPATGEVITDRNVTSANIKINPDGRPSFKASDDNVTSVGSTNKKEGNSDIKVNLFKRFSQKPKEGTVRSPDAKGNWKWTKTPDGFDKVETIISVVHKGKHFFALETDFTKGVSLKKYPNNKDEPRLKPTVVGKIELGQPIGEVNMRGKTHNVYNKIKTFNSGGLMTRV